MSGPITSTGSSAWPPVSGRVLSLPSQNRRWRERPSRSPPTSRAPRPPVPDDGEVRWLYWNDHVMGGRAFLPFVSFKHSTLGEVELGGWKPGVRLNPPAEQVEPIATANQAFLGELVRRIPRLEIGDVKVEARGGGIFQLSARITNEGGFPTALTQGVRNRKAAPVRLRLDTGSARLLAGPARTQIDALGGSGGYREFRWLILVSDPKRSVGNHTSRSMSPAQRRERSAGRSR